MKVRIYMATAKYDWERDLLRRWYDGIRYIAAKKNLDIDLDFNYEDFPEKRVDVGIIYGGARPAAKGIHDVRKNIIDGCRTFIINETPLLGRTITKQHSWHRVGINGHLHGQGDFNAKNKDGHRLATYKDQWNLRHRPWKTGGKDVVLALQLPGDSSLRKQELSDWAINTIDKLSAITDKNIIIRTHPAFSDDDHCQIINLYKHIGKLGSNRIKFSYGNLVSWDSDLENCYCVIAYSSGLSIDAIDNGIPVIAVDQANFAYNISSHFVEEIENLKLAGDQEKQKWYNELSYSQWSTSEIQAGVVWEHLWPAIERKLLEL